jgi:hypothetical protein
MPDAAKLDTGRDDSTQESRVKGQIVTTRESLVPPNAAGDLARLGLVRPPLVHLMSIVVGTLIHLAAPLPFVPRTLAMPLGASLVVVAIPLFSFSVAKFRAAGTPVPARKPTTAIVRTGPIASAETRFILRSQCSRSVSRSGSTACGCWPHSLERCCSCTTSSFPEKSSTWSDDSVPNTWTTRPLSVAGCKPPNRWQNNWPQGATSPAFSAIGRAMRTSERKNLPGSSVIGTCAECSNQTRCFSGA